MPQTIRLKSREPLLCDKLLHEPRDPLLPREFVSDAKKTLLEAKKFILDEQAATYFGEMLRECPRIVADAMDFAIPPFPTCWIEVPFRAFYRAVTGLAPDDWSDERVGYLINGSVVKVAAQGASPSEALDASWMPVRYVLHEAPSEAEDAALRAELVPDSALDMLYWGESIRSLTQAHEHAAVRTLRRSHRIEPILIGSGESEQEKRKDWWELMSHSNGDVRNVVGLLLFLNRTRSDQDVQTVGLSSTLVRRKRMALYGHSVIRLRANPVPRLLTLGAGEAILRRLHDVRGHFCHNRVARTADCRHENWEEIAPLRWRCGRCSGLRWWRREHSRGHAAEGTVESRYVLTA